MRSLNLNIARAFVGRHVNLHLKDGSVLVNVFIAEAKREENDGKAAVFCLSKHRRTSLKITLRDVTWMEQVSPHVLHGN